MNIFSGKILLDSIVNPKVELRHLNTRFAGVTGAIPNHKENRTCLEAHDETRNHLMKWAGPNTIVVAPEWVTCWPCAGSTGAWLMPLVERRRANAEAKPKPSQPCDNFTCIARFSVGLTVMTPWRTLPLGATWGDFGM